MKYLFDHRKALQNRLSKKNIFLFLDYDGTLAPIVRIPQKAKISKKCRGLLKKLSQRKKIRLAVISGRSLKDIRGRVGIKNIIYSGNHGLEVIGPGFNFANAVSQDYKKTIKEIKRVLNSRLADLKGAIVEDKGLTLSIHYRMVAKDKLFGLKATLRRTIGAALINKKIKIRSGKKVFEIRPPIKSDKGRIVNWLLKKYNSSGKQKGAIPIYIGDDQTDEDAFKALKKRGLTIFVGKPKKSSAQYYLKSTDEVVKFLNILARDN